MANLRRLTGSLLLVSTYLLASGADPNEQQDELKLQANLKATSDDGGPNELQQFTQIRTARSVTSDGPHKWNTTDRWGCWEDNGYKLCNNVWGNDHGDQSMWADSYSHWGVSAQHPKTDGVKSYPFSEKQLNKSLSSLETLTSKYDVTVPDGDDNYEAAYDIWDTEKKYEIMLWMVTNGGAKPIAEEYGQDGQPKVAKEKVQVGGHTWNVFKGVNKEYGGQKVYSFIRTPSAKSGEVDVKELFEWIKDQGWFDKDIIVGAFQFGFEITSVPDQKKEFICNDFSVDFKAKDGSGSEDSQKDSSSGESKPQSQTGSSTGSGSSSSGTQSNPSSWSQPSPSSWSQQRSSSWSQPNPSSWSQQRSSSWSQPSRSARSPVDSQQNSYGFPANSFRGFRW